mmetsp:Transcript_12225/g.49235  ORF Transcript_12225/g.49235 Transcript_12225/m.49235 type:complete len:418 (-) Transcript_12225:1120-2373(-)
MVSGVAQWSAPVDCETRKRREVLVRCARMGEPERSRGYARVARGLEPAASLSAASKARSSAVQPSAMARSTAMRVRILRVTAGRGAGRCNATKSFMGSTARRVFKADVGGSHGEFLVGRDAALSEVAREAAFVGVGREVDVVGHVEVGDDGDVALEVLREKPPRPAGRGVDVAQILELGEHVGAQEEFEGGEDEAAAPCVLRASRRGPPRRLARGAVRVVEHGDDVRVDLGSDDELCVEGLLEADRGDVGRDRAVEVGLATGLCGDCTRLGVLLEKDGRRDEPGHAGGRRNSRRDDDVRRREMRQQYGRRSFALGADRDGESSARPFEGVQKRHVFHARLCPVVCEPAADVAPRIAIVRDAVPPVRHGALPRRPVEAHEVLLERVVVPQVALQLGVCSRADERRDDRARRGPVDDVG